MCNQTFRFGGTIEALPGTITDLFAEGRQGIVMSVERQTGRVGLVRWGDDPILFGFHAENVRIVSREA